MKRSLVASALLFAACTAQTPQASSSNNAAASAQRAGLVAPPELASAGSTVAPRPAPNAATAASARASSARPPAARPAVSCGMPADLVARGWRTELTPTSPIETPPFEPGTTTLVALPDIQYYASCHSRYFPDQLAWLAAERTRRNVPLAVTLGDLTDHNSPAEWRYVKDGVSRVAGELPLVLVTGNHDYGPRGTAKSRTSLLSQFFAKPPGAAAPLLAERLAGSGLDNAYYRIPLPKVTLGVLALEWSPRAATVAWANGVLDKYPTDRAIVVTHAYLYYDGTRYDWKTKGKAQEWNPLSYGTASGEAPDAFDGEMLWNALVKKHENVFLVLAGHVLGNGTGVLSSRGEHGNVVHQILVNFQMLRDGGLGYLRLLELLPDGRTLRLKTFSPTLGVFATGADQTGTLELDPGLW